jgi:hypothetical protein
VFTVVGGKAIYVVVEDIADFAEVKKAAETAVNVSCSRYLDHIGDSVATL